ncbi:MAG: hypothetical protein MJZ05_01500 [Fibrobacter sp.]|nr:hypothetical protein [Fibrobacter sp.]
MNIIAKSFWGLSLVFVATSYFACSGEGVFGSESSNSEEWISEDRIYEPDELEIEGPERTLNISGRLLKMKNFCSKAVVNLYELDERMKKTGVVYTYHPGRVAIPVGEKYYGNYVFNDVALRGRYALISASGYDIYNSDSSLKTLIDLDHPDSLNLNVLGHLAYERERYLVSQGASIEEAVAQAESEVLRTLNFEEDSLHFYEMSIYGERAGDAKLMAASVLTEILIGNDNVAMDKLNSIARNIAKNGAWDGAWRRSVALGLYVESRKEKPSYSSAAVLEKCEPPSLPDYEPYIERFISSEQPIYGSCQKENETKLAKLCEMDDVDECSTHTYICKSNVWKKYPGLERYGSTNFVDVEFGSFKDERDGREYKTVVLETDSKKKVEWMAEDLKYGGDSLFTWEAAVVESEVSMRDSSVTYHGICPEGWHIPSVKEWNAVNKSVYNLQRLDRLKYVEDDNSYGGESVSFWLTFRIDLENCTSCCGCVMLYSSWFAEVDRNNGISTYGDGSKSVRCVKD